MAKKDYIERAKNIILNRVKFHAPVVFDGNIDKRVLFENGIDLNKPIFKFDKVMTKPILKAFLLAQKQQDFNLLVPFSSLGKAKKRQLKKLKSCLLYSPETSSISFIEMINKLNINYASSSNYNLVFKDKFFKINNEILNPTFDDFQLKQKLTFGEIVVNYSEFVLNGINFFARFLNCGQDESKITVELNIPLEKGYYFFKRQNGCVLIQNLFTNQKRWLNFSCKNAKLSFSDVDGLDNSVFSCINIKISINMKAKKEDFVFFNFGESKIRLKKLAYIEKFLEISQTKCKEIFNVRVKTRDLKFDQFFNYTLPKKIWINWLNDKPDFELEKKYTVLKRLFLKEKMRLVDFEKIGLKELGVFNGEYYKKIMIIKSPNKFLRMGKTVFHNVAQLSNEILKSKEPIELSFG